MNDKYQLLWNSWCKAIEDIWMTSQYFIIWNFHIMSDKRLFGSIVFSRNRAATIMYTHLVCYSTPLVTMRLKDFYQHFTCSSRTQQVHVMDDVIIVCIVFWHSKWWMWHTHTVLCSVLSCKWCNLITSIGFIIQLY